MFCTCVTYLVVPQKQSHSFFWQALVLSHVDSPMHICIGHTYVNICMNVHRHVDEYIFIWMNGIIHTYTCIRMYTYVYVDVCVRIYICMCV